MPGLEDILVGGAPATITADDIVKRVRNILEDEPWEDYLSDAYTAADGMVSTVSPTNWSEGNIMEFDDGTYSQARVLNPGADIYKWAGNPISIKAADDNTPDANHASGVTVLKNARFGGWVIYQHVTDIIAELSPYVWTVKQASITPSPTTTNLYAMPADYIGLIRRGVTQQLNQTVIDTTIYDEKVGAVREVRGVTAGLLANTVCLRFPGGFDNLTKPVTVNYRAEVTASAIPDDNIARLIVLGALERLMAGKEIPLGADNQDINDPGATLRPGDLLRIAAYDDREYRALLYTIRATLRTLVGTPARTWMG